MSKKKRTKVVFCEAKKRYVEVEYTDDGPWYSPDRKLEYCPAVNDPGHACNYACMRKMDVPKNMQHGGPETR